MSHSVTRCEEARDVTGSEADLLAWGEALEKTACKRKVESLPQIIVWRRCDGSDHVEQRA